MSLLHIAGGATEDKLDASDVFSTYLYTGNGSTQTINNGIDLAGKGGMVWIKDRDGTGGHFLTDTVRGLGKQLSTHSVGQENYEATAINSWNSNGFSMGAKTDVNTNSRLYASWTFRESPKFYHQEIKVHTNGIPSTVDLSTLGEVGMVTVKSTINTGNWFTWHRSLTVGNNLKLNLTDAQSPTNAYLSVSGTTLTIASTAPSDTYIIYAWAHDTGTDGIIQCGSFTTDGSGNATVNLGWEPQYLDLRIRDVADSWKILDNMRGIPTGGADFRLYANLASTEAEAQTIELSPTGFYSNATLSASQTYIYMAIRRPNKVPTSGTEVYNAIARTGTGATVTVNTSIVPDLCIGKCRSNTPYSHVFMDRLRGLYHLLSSATDAEASSGSSYYSKLTNNTVTIGTATDLNENTYTYINHFFKRAKGFFDIVCYTGTGVARTVNHNLGAVPELMIVKDRNPGAEHWRVYYKFDGSGRWNIFLNLTNAGSYDLYSAGGDGLPTLNTVSFGASAGNYSGSTYIAYLFASLPGVSKVGSYTGNGTSQTINCGFSTGARFVLSKAVSTTGNWNIGDSTRGITSGTDPLLCLNTTAAEVTTDDWLDPESSGFIVNETASVHANTNGVQYVFLAIA